MTRFHNVHVTKRGALFALGATVAGTGIAVGSTSLGSSPHTAQSSRANYLGAHLTASELPASLQTVYNQALADVPSQSSLYATYQSDNIVVSVNGTHLNPQELSAEASQLEQTAVATAVFNQYVQSGTNAGVPTPSSVAQQVSSASFQSTLLDQAIAANVFMSLIYSYAEANGLAVTTATATQEAAQNLQDWQTSGSPTLPIPAGEPAGTTDQDLFDSPEAIATLQVAGSVANAEQAIAGAPDATGTGSSRTPALAAWMTTTLASANVSATVNGVALAAGSLPGLLPARM